MALSPQMADLSLGQRIRLARDAEGMSQRELAEKIGMSRDRISDYENGADVPSGALRAICEVLNVASDWLLFGATRAYLHGRVRRLRLIHGSGHGSTTHQLPLIR